MDLDTLDTQIRDSALDLDEAVGQLVALKEYAGDIRQLSRDLETYVAELMPQKQMDVAGKHVEVKTEIRRSDWQHDDLLRLILDTRMVDPETGEIESQLDTVKACYAVKGYNCRIGALKERGIDVGDFCTEDFGAKRLKIT